MTIAYSRKTSRRGFTMIEVVIAVSILSLIMAIAYSSISQIIRSKKMLDDGRDASLVANAVLSRLTRELQLAIGQSALINLEANDGSTLGGVSFLGSPKKSGSDRASDSLQFLALEGGQYLPDGGTHSGIVQISYHVEKNEGAEPGENETYALVRDEVPYTRPFKTALKGVMTFPVTKDLVSLAFSYYDSRDKQWVSEWGEGAHSKLPAMVKLQVKLKSPQGTVSAYSTVVALRAGN